MTDLAVYLVRHGRTAHNASGKVRGRVDVPLDERGVDEAAALGTLFADVRLSRVISSPLIRALDTARAIGAATGTPVIEDSRLIDRDYGSWQGRPEQEVRTLLREERSVPGIEPETDVRRRARQALEDWLADEDAAPVALVAHEAVNRLLIVELFPSLGDPEALPQPTGCWNLLRRSDVGWTAQVVGAVPGDGRWP